MGLSLSTLLRHYKRQDIQEEILYNSLNREVAVSFEGKGYGKRPDTIQYPSDILESVKNKVTSFHISEEIWKNPLQLSSGMTDKEKDQLRKGWDLVLDIDGIFDFSKLVAKNVIGLLKSYNIKAISCKFSGNKGFHIGVPFESFPSEVNGEKIEKLFPEAARRVAAFIWEKIKKPLADEILKKYGVEKIQEMTSLPFEKITMKENGNIILNTKELVDIDTILISSRHLYRSSYSFNEKSGLVSIPIRPERVEKFTKTEAKPENVRISKHRFLDREKAVKGEAKRLFEDSFDFTFDEREYMKKEFEEQRKEIANHKRNYEADELAEAIPIEYFPPCMHNVLKGLKDGKKRSLFIMVNFLTSVGWGYEEIEKLIIEWNKKNENDLKEGIIKNHIRYHKQNKKKVLPPNCDNKAYYVDIGICTPDNLCNRIKNPVQYAKIKSKYARLEKEKEKNKTKKKEAKKREDNKREDNKKAKPSSQKTEDQSPQQS